jgi:4-hydroxybenzoate polyprenyltransferase
LRDYDRAAMASEPIAVRAVPRERAAAAALLAAMRPRQWLKNLLLFAGLVFAAELGDGTRWLRALAAFAVYCAASSAAYLVNDVRDADADRRHPTKRTRPVASGELSPRHALAAAGLLGVAAILGAAALGRESLLLLLAFLGLQLLYSARLKHVVLVDVLAIAALFVIRAAAGAVAIDVRISGWLLVCTGLLALFLALNKRRGELADGGDGSSRRVLRRYDLRLLDRLVLGTGAATLAVYAAYTVTGTRPPLFPLTIVPVAFGLARYVFLVRRRAAGQEPEKVLVGDGPILAATLAWAVLAAVLLAVA